MKCGVFLKYTFLLILGYLAKSYFKIRNVPDCCCLSGFESLLLMNINDDIWRVSCSMCFHVASALVILQTDSASVFRVPVSARRLSLLPLHRSRRCSA